MSRRRSLSDGNLSLTYGENNAGGIYHPILHITRKGKRGPMDPMKQRALSKAKLEIYEQRKRGIKNPSVVLKIPRTMWMRNYESYVLPMLEDASLNGTFREGLRQVPAWNHPISMETMLDVLFSDVLKKEEIDWFLLGISQFNTVFAGETCYTDECVTSLTRWEDPTKENPWSSLYGEMFDGTKIQRLSGEVHRALLNNALNIIFEANAEKSWKLARRISWVRTCNPEFFERQIERLLRPLHGHCKGFNSIDFLNAKWGFKSYLLLNEEDSSDEEDTETE